jgi:sugar phosphate isomerase/epimerase
LPLAERLPLGVTAVMLPELDFDEQIDLCAQLGVTHYVFRPREIAANRRGEAYSNWGNHRFDLTPERFAEQGAQLGRQLREAGLRPFCAVPSSHSGSDRSVLEQDMIGCAQAGCASIRLMPPPYPSGVFDFDAYLAEAIAALQQAVEMARGFGLKVVIEMHAGTSGASPGLARLLVRQFSPEHLGLVPDLANFAREGAVNPDLGVSAVQRWIDHLHVGGAWTVEGEPDDLGWRTVHHPFCSLSASDLDVRGWVVAIGRLGRTVPLIIEDYTDGLSGGERLRRSVEELRTLIAHLDRQEVTVD